MGAEIVDFWVPEPDGSNAVQAAPRVNATVLVRELTTGQTCDKHPSALAEFVSPALGLTFCGHCARYGAARELALEPIGDDVR